MATAETLAAPAAPSRLAGFAPALAIGLCAGLLPLLASRAIFWAAVAALGFLPILWYGFCKPKLWPLLFCGSAILLPPLPFPIGDSGVHVSILIAGAMGYGMNLALLLTERSLVHWSGK